MLKQILVFKIQVVKINILFEFGLKACTKKEERKKRRYIGDSGVTSQLQMAAVYTDYNEALLTRVPTKDFLELETEYKLNDDLTGEAAYASRCTCL